MKELPRYKSHKTVHALKIHNIDVDLGSGDAVITPEDEGFGPFAVDAEYMGKHKPRIGGYYVVYEDGYKSWSPADAFEKGYVKESKLEAEGDFMWKAIALMNQLQVLIDSKRPRTHEHMKAVADRLQAMGATTAAMELENVVP